MRILITGGTGFIGGALVPALLARGHQLTVLSRQTLPEAPGLRYLSSLDAIAADAELDAIINLAGASLAGRRWTQAYKAEIRESRLGTTRALLQLIERLETRPGTLLSASAVGYYGHHGDTLLDENGSTTPGFAHSLCADWEALAGKVADCGVRTCWMRLGVVLDRDGGAFTQMARSFHFGVGTWIGSGDQWLSWIHRRDALAAILFLLDHPALTGPFNLTAPEPVTHRRFCEVLGRHYRTLFSMPVPAPVARLALGEMADELLLQGQRVVPTRLRGAGFEFALPDVERAVGEICAAR